MRAFPGSARLLQVWDSLRTSFWFVPTLMATGAVALSFASVHLDERVSYKWVRAVGWLWAGGPEGARQVLSTIAGSMITVAGVAFSITIVALTLASSQFGPRLLRNFVRDLGNQVVLGTFIATFVYCLLVLRTVRGTDGAEFVPYISVTLGVAFALADLGVLIYFIHHVATSIQAGQLIAAVAGELEQAIDEMFPEELDGGAPGGPGPDGVLGPPETEAPAPPPQSEGLSVRASRSGYVQLVDQGALLALAVAGDLVLDLHSGPGRFVIEGRELARIQPAGRAGPDTADRVRAAFLLGTRRTPSQDPEYAVHQLVEIAVRALSPGINDPFTAMNCLYWLGAALSRMASRRIPSRHLYDEGGRLRVITPRTDFPAMADAAFNQIRQYGRGSVSVLLRLLDTIAGAGENARRPDDRACLRRHADQVAADARATLSNEGDRREIEERHVATLRILTPRGDRMADGREDR
jgi:uncharacterized membrane protein